MLKIRNTQDFFEAVQQPNAIIFLHTTWSAASASSRRCAEKFHRHIGWEIPVFEIDIDEFDSIHDWVAQKERTNWETSGVMRRKAYSFKNRLHGSGEMMWIRNGEIVGFEVFVAALNYSGLMDKTSFLYWEYLTKVAC